MNASDILVENEKPKITPFPIGRPEILGERLFRLENDEKRRGRKLVGGGGRFREAINSCVFCVCVCVCLEGGFDRLAKPKIGKKKQPKK